MSHKKKKFDAKAVPILICIDKDSGEWECQFFDETLQTKCLHRESNQGSIRKHVLRVHKRSSTTKRGFAKAPSRESWKVK